MRREWSRRIWGAVAVIAVFAACGTANPPPVDDNGSTSVPMSDASVANSCIEPGVEGCPCAPGTSPAACGHVVQRTGDYVTCSMGTSSCNGQTWGPCEGAQILTKSVADRPLKTLKKEGPFLSVTGPCTNNICDPNTCTQTTNGPSDVVDASGVTTSDAGLTLLLGDASAASSCTGLQCAVPNCDAGGTTSITGFVYDPANNNPLYNVLVYIPVAANGALPALASNATINQCSGAAPVPTVAYTQTAVDGSFTLTGVPSGTGIPAGSGIPIVVQTGEWRREIMLSSITPCTTNPMSSATCTSAIPSGQCVLRLPGNQKDGYNYADGTYDHGDMPQIAIVTGHYDPFECLLLKIGISPTEFGSVTNVNVSNSSSRRVHLFQSPDYPGTYLPSTYGDQVTGDKLWAANPSILPNYGVVLLPCEGAPFDKMSNANPMSETAQNYLFLTATTQGVPTTQKPPASGVNPYKNLITYANNGGRVFATHYSYVWLEYPHLFSYITSPDGGAVDDWGSVATWDHAWTSSTKIMDINVYPTPDPLTGTIVQPSTFPKGIAFAQWLENMGASINGTTIQLHETRHDLTAVGANSQPWMTATDTNSGVSPQAFDPHFTFNTPYNNPSSTQYGRVVFSDFHVSEQALIAEGTGGGTTCTDNTDCGFTQTCNAVAHNPRVIGTCNEPCSSTQDCASSSYTCTSGACKKSCTNSSQCTGGELCINSSKVLCTSDASTGCTCNGCYSTGNCFSNQGLAWCSGATTGSCTPTPPTAPSNEDAPGTTTTTLRAPLSLTGNGTTENNGWFPTACAQSQMLAQEQALEFMFFDLTGCVSPDLPPAAPPPPVYQPATFTQTFTASCNAGFNARWTEFDYHATIPSGTSITFSFQSGTSTSTLAPSSAPYPSATATTSTAAPPGTATKIYLDTSLGTSTVSLPYDAGTDAGPHVLSDAGTGLLNAAAVPSSNVLVVTITLTPNAADAATSIAPTLIDWDAISDCVSAE